MWAKFIHHLFNLWLFCKTQFQHSNIHCSIIYYYIIYSTIYLFIYILKKEFTMVKIFQWLCGKKIVKREAGANHDLCQPVIEVR